MKPRIAWFSVLGAEGGGGSTSAYWSDVLLPELRRHFEMEVFHNSFEPYRDYPTFHYLTALPRHSVRPYDVFFYQLEDSKASYFTRIHLALKPGVVLLHDFIFKDDGPEPILNSAWEPVVKKFLGLGTEWPERGAEHKKKGPQGYRESGCAALALFSSERDLGEYQRLTALHVGAELSRSYYVPHPVRVSAAPLERPRSPFTIAFAGTPGLEHRAHKLFEAAEGIEEVEVKWLINRTEEAAACGMLEDFASAKVELLFERNMERWLEVLGGASAACHLHFSAYGQPGPYLPASLARGLPCLVSNFGGSDYLDDALVFKVNPGLGEASEIRAAIKELLEERVDLPCDRIAAFAREKHDHRAVAEELAAILKDRLPDIQKISRRWECFESRAREALLAEVRELAGEDRVASLIKGPVSELGWEAP